MTQHERGRWQLAVRSIADDGGAKRPTEPRRTPRGLAEIPNEREPNVDGLLLP